jgi:single-stranded-DNA-specific exonuclease
VLAPEDLVPSERVDAVVAGDELGLRLAEDLERLAPFGVGNPEVSLLVPAARLSDPRPMGEGKHLRFTVESGGVRARRGRVRRRRAAGRHDGRSTRRSASSSTSGTARSSRGSSCAAPSRPSRADRARPASPRTPSRRRSPSSTRRSSRRAGARRRAAPRDRADGGAAGSSPRWWPPASRARRVRRRPRAPAHLAGRLGGFALCSWAALERDPALAAGAAHVVALDPPAAGAGARAALAARDGAPRLGRGRDGFALAVLERTCALRARPRRSTARCADGPRLARARGDRPPPAAPAARCACWPSSASSPSTGAARRPSARRRAHRTSSARRRSGPRPRAARAARARRRADGSRRPGVDRSIEVSVSRGRGYP